MMELSTPPSRPGDMRSTPRAATSAALILLVTVILAACSARLGAGSTPGASDAPSASGTPATSGTPGASSTPASGDVLPDGTGVRGTVTSGPVCPVVTEPPTPGCADRPVAGAVLVLHDAAGTEVARVTSAADGTFSVELAPGAYRLIPQPFHGLMGTPAPIDVGVEAGQQMTEVKVSYDTGIR
jgi:hypothetical protein